MRPQPLRRAGRVARRRVPAMATAKCIRAPAVGGSGRGFVSSQRLALVFLVAVDDVATDLGRADLERGGVLVVLDVATVEVETVAEPPCLTCTLPPTRERELTETWRAFSPWTLPIPRTPRRSAWPALDLDRVLHVRALQLAVRAVGHAQLSTVIAPSVPRSCAPRRARWTGGRRRRPVRRRRPGSW